MWTVAHRCRALWEEHAMIRNSISRADALHCGPANSATYVSRKLRRQKLFFLSNHMFLLWLDKANLWYVSSALVTINATCSSSSANSFTVNWENNRANDSSLITVSVYYVCRTINVRNVITNRRTFNFLSEVLGFKITFQWWKIDLSIFAHKSMRRCL